MGGCTWVGHRAHPPLARKRVQRGGQLAEGGVEVDAGVARARVELLPARGARGGRSAKGTASKWFFMHGWMDQVVTITAQMQCRSDDPWPGLQGARVRLLPAGGCV